jgi:uncharacterized lipoprotein YmbA
MMTCRAAPALLHPLIALIAPLLVLLASGCASSPPSHFYTLSATTRPAASAAPTPARPPMSIAVGPVSLPALIDRPQIVVSTASHEVRIDDANRWASPLQDAISRVIAENLAAQLATPRVILFAQSGSANAGYRVVIDVQGFESTPGQSASLDATWTVRRIADGKAQDGRSKFTEAVKDPSYAALAAAHSRALERLSHELGDALRTLER